MYDHFFVFVITRLEVVGKKGHLVAKRKLVCRVRFIGHQARVVENAHGDELGLDVSLPVKRKRLSASKNGFHVQISVRKFADDLEVDEQLKEREIEPAVVGRAVKVENLNETGDVGQVGVGDAHLDPVRTVYGQRIDVSESQGSASRQKNAVSCVIDGWNLAAPINVFQRPK